MSKVSSTEVNKIISTVEASRLSYKPDVVKYLLIAEAPPDNGTRFFYYKNVFKHDDLFVGVASVLYPDLKESHIKHRRERNGDVKSAILQKLKEEGFYLLDLSNLPLSLLNNNLESCVPDLINRVNNVSSKNTKIILIKTNVYDIAYSSLMNYGLNVIDARISFPGSGGQKKFRIKFIDALQQAGYIFK